MEKKEAMKILKDFYVKSALFSIRTALDTVIPELKESEDERIRKEIMKFIFNYPRKLINRDSWLDWLEKQGDIVKNNMLLPFKEYDNLMDSINKKKKEGYEAGYKQGLSDSKSEQRPILNIETPFGAKDSELQEASYHIPEGFHVEIEGNRVVIKRGEQEPEWTPMDEQRVENLLAIVEGHGYPEEVAWLNSLKDRVQSKQSKQKFLDDIVKEVTKDKDAAISFLKSTGIINENGELADEYKIEQGEQKSQEEEVDNLHNYLYGEQKTAWNEEVITNYINEKIAFLGYTHQDSKKIICKGDLQDTLLSAILFGKYIIMHKKGWSKEDESQFTYIKANLEYLQKNDVSYKSKEDQALLNKQIYWLKSLKDRVQPQPKPAWSEEDEINLKYTTRIIERLYDKQEKNYLKESLERKLNWLKSLKERYTWKPSEEQMETLWCATEKYLESDNENVRRLRGDVLESLYNDLKKLTE